jgi:phage protein U
VTEQLSSDGKSEIGGVYTSVPDLIDRGLHWREGVERKDGFRLTLVKLDSTSKPLGCWYFPEFSGMQNDLQEYVASNEFTSVEVETLLEALAGFHAAV